MRLAVRVKLERQVIEQIANPAGDHSPDGTDSRITVRFFPNQQRCIRPGAPQPLVQAQAGARRPSLPVIGVKETDSHGNDSLTISNSLPPIAAAVSEKELQ